MKTRSLLLALVVGLISVAVKGAAPYDAVGRLTPPGKTWGGSCVLIYASGDRGLIVSNAHVCDDADTFEAHWGKETRTAKTVAFYAEEDLCFLVIENPPVKPARLGIRDSNVVFTGYPHYDRDHLHWQKGTFVDENLRYVAWKNEAVPGMSGGAVFDQKDGDLCGIVEASKDGYGFGVASVSLILNAWKHEDPKTWIPDGSHVNMKKPNWKPAKPSKVIITKVYDEKTAPKLGE